jgi:hypothetical protein
MRRDGHLEFYESKKRSPSHPHQDIEEGKIMEHDNPEFEEAFGIYVAPATHDEVVAALRDAIELVVRIDNRESTRPGEGIRYRHGWAEHFHEEYEDHRVRDLFVVHQHQQALEYGVMYQDAPFVIWLTSAYRNLDAAATPAGCDCVPNSGR